MKKERLVVGLSGASGVILGIRFLEILSKIEEFETHLVISDAAKKTISYETEWNVKDVETLADHVHDFNNVGSSIASGSFKTKGMVIIPCSVKTLSAIALKERRRLVLVVREMPLHRGHLEAMLRVHDLGGVILPPMLTFYQRPQNLGEMTDYVVGKVLDALEIPHNLYKRWGEKEPAKGRLA
jgi:4-hydroxy-3-polyprenylbenzoate decarboxylase